VSGKLYPIRIIEGSNIRNVILTPFSELLSLLSAVAIRNSEITGREKVGIFTSHVKL
jgi:hypothetical protein